MQIHSDSRTGPDSIDSLSASVMAKTISQALWSANSVPARWLPRHPFGPRDHLLWLPAFVLPLCFIGLVATLIFARTKARLRIVTSAIARTEAWLKLSEKYRMRYDNLCLTREQCRRYIAQETGRRQRLAARVALRLIQITMWWTNVRSLTGKYLDSDEHKEVSKCDSSLRSSKERYYRRLECDRGAARQMFKEMWAGFWEALISRRGIGGVMWGAVTVVLAVLVAALVGYHSNGPLVGQDEKLVAAAFASVLAAAATYWVGVRGTEERRRLFAWGASIVMFLGLTTIELSSLEGTGLDQAIDSQKVDAMFLAVAVLMALRQFLDSPDRLTEMRKSELRMIEKAGRLTCWARAAHRVGRWRPRYRWEKLTMGAVMLFYAGLSVYFVWPMAQALGEEQTASVVSLGTAIVGVTIAVLILPLRAFVGGEGSRSRGGTGRGIMSSGLVVLTIGLSGCQPEERDAIGVELRTLGIGQGTIRRWIMAEDPTADSLFDTLPGRAVRGTVELGQYEDEQAMVHPRRRRVPVRLASAPAADLVVIETRGASATILAGGEKMTDAAAGHREVQLRGRLRTNQVSIEIELPRRDSVILDVEEWYIGNDQWIREWAESPPGEVVIRDSTAFRVQLTYSLVDDVPSPDSCETMDPTAQCPPVPDPQPTLICWASNPNTNEFRVRQYVCESVEGTAFLQDQPPRDQGEWAVLADTRQRLDRFGDR